MTTGLITAPVTTTTATTNGEAAEKTLIQRVEVRSSTGTSDVAGVSQNCVRGGTRPLRTRPQLAIRKAIGIDWPPVPSPRKPRVSSPL
jgi:hypothetical protein